MSDAPPLFGQPATVLPLSGAKGERPVPFGGHYPPEL